MTSQELSESIATSAVLALVVFLGALAMRGCGS